MATFTVRVPDSMAGRLSSVEMRTWLTQFLRSPYRPWLGQRTDFADHT